jgi:hypothetical protein
MRAVSGAGKETICPLGAILASSPDASSFFSLALPGSSAAKKRRGAGGLNPQLLRFDKSYRGPRPG